jgi:hypothetical protein
MERRTPTTRPAGEHWQGASIVSLASALASATRRGMLRRGFAPPCQPALSGNGASAVLIPHRARRPEVLALLGSRSVPAAPVTTDAACRAAAPCLPALQYPGHRLSVAWAQVPAWLVAGLPLVAVPSCGCSSLGRSRGARAGARGGTAQAKRGPKAPAGSDSRHGPAALQPAAAHQRLSLHHLAIAQPGF